MGEWEFTASAYIVNVYWASWLNESYWDVPKTREIDSCGPPNSVSAGYALWLALIPAVGCVVQCPGSVFLFRRSNFYRFAPEIGIADSLAVLTLVLKAWFKGYRWKESVAAVLLVREGIGRGELWWRDTVEIRNSAVGQAMDHQAQADEENSTMSGSGIGESAAYNEQPQHEDRVRAKLRVQLQPFVNGVSTERVIGSSLFIVSLVKTIALLANSPNNPTIRLAASIALAYSFSFIILEALVWNAALVSPDYILSDVPALNFLELLRAVDPGDNPFTFTSPHDPVRDTGGNTDLEMDGQSTPSEPSSNVSSRPMISWNKAVAVCAASPLVLSPLLWVLILKSIWSSNKKMIILSLTTLAFFGVRFGWKLAIKNGSSGMPQSLRSVIPSKLRAIGHSIGVGIRKLRHAAGARTDLFVVHWVLERITIVNLFSALWITITFVSFIGSFGQRGDKEPSNLLLKPMWLDWLG